MNTETDTRIEYFSSKKDSFTIIEIYGSIDTYNCAKLKSTLFKLVDEGKNNLVIDLKNTDFFDSSAISILLSTYHKCAATEGSIKLINADDSITDLLHLATLDTLISILPNENSLPNTL